MKHKNFYESLDEASRRLHDTVVTYDGDPVQIIAITNHKPDGIFRLYCWPCNVPMSVSATSLYPRTIIQGYRHQSNELGIHLDAYMAANPKTPLMRKYANSPSFNSFRPFSLGMMNNGGRATFLERSPERRTQQGLMRAMVETTPVTLDEEARFSRPFHDSLCDPSFYDCVKGQHPTARECLENFRDPSVTNQSVAFDRNFALVRGPLNTMFVGYKTNIVGVVPSGAVPKIELDKRFRHLREVVEETKQFEDISVRN